MPSRSEIEAFRSRNVAITSRLSRDLARFWGGLDLSNPETARDALVEYVPRLVAQYGDLAATVAADLYDELRSAAGVRRRFSAVLARGVPDEAVVQRVRFGAQHLWTDHPEDTLKFIDGAAGKYALQAGRDTIATSSRRDPAKAKWARVAEPDACEFCLMLAGRDFAYTSEDAAAGEYHDNCQCVAVPSWD